MRELVLSLSPEINQRLECMAEKLDRSVVDCAQLALSEFLENWEDYLQTLAILSEDNEDRPVLSAIPD
ncbi:MAG TPA: hypothetical protein HPP80_01700 [Rhodospirillaceae bacterium]|nr:hypothetical protein [Rhodospirillaceae bacterium]